jgi:hypothetical protein
MSAYLASLLSKEKSTFKKLIDDIEHASGHSSQDLKLSSDIKIATNYKLKALGLNPEDTTAPELYQSLSNLFNLHDAFLVNKIGMSYSSPISLALDKIASSFNEPENAVKIFSIKSNIIRKLLVKNKPLNTTKLMGYRSFDSMLKNEDPKTLISLAYYVESESWKEQYFNLIKTLAANDFEYKSVKTLVLNSKKFVKIANKITDTNGYNVIAVENIGQILVVPYDSQLKPGFCLLSYAYITHRIKALVKVSDFIEANRFNANFGASVAKYLNSYDKLSFSISKHNFSWDSFTNLFGIAGRSEVEDIDTLAVDHHSNKPDSLDQILIKLEPALGFWSDSDYLGYVDNKKIISLNLLDACYNFYNNLDISTCTHIFMEISLERELISRYLSSKSVNDHVTQQITDDPEENEFIQIFKNRVVYS